MGRDEIWYDMSIALHIDVFLVLGELRAFVKSSNWCFSMTGIVITCHVAAQLQCFWESYPSFWKWDLVALLVGQRILLSHYFAVSQHPSWHVTGPLHFMICSRRRCHMLIHWKLLCREVCFTISHCYTHSTTSWLPSACDGRNSRISHMVFCSSMAIQI